MIGKRREVVTCIGQRVWWNVLWISEETGRRQRGFSILT